MADCAGVRPHIGLRGTSHQRFGQPSWCNPGDCWLRRLVSRCVARGEARVSVSERVTPVTTRRPQVARVAWMTQELHRARLPLEIYPISAGVKGGLAGSVAMAVLAVIYGIISGHGLWYPINLLSAGFFPARTTIEQIAVFHWDALIIATIIHLLCSVLVGLLYGVALPSFPPGRFLLEGGTGPSLGSGLP